MYLSLNNKSFFSFIEHRISPSPSCLDKNGAGTGEGYVECVDNKCVCQEEGENSYGQCCTEAGGDGENGCSSTGGVDGGCEYPVCYFNFFHLLLLLTQCCALLLCVYHSYNHSRRLS